MSPSPDPLTTGIRPCRNRRSSNSCSSSSTGGASFSRSHGASVRSGWILGSDKQKEKVFSFISFHFIGRSPGGKIIQALLVFFLKLLAGIARLDFLGFSSIELTLSLDFQGVGKAWNSHFYLKFKLILPNPSLVAWIPADQYQQAISRKSQKWAWNKLDILENPSKVELGFSRILPSFFLQVMFSLLSL